MNVYNIICEYFGVTFEQDTNPVAIFNVTAVVVSVVSVVFVAVVKTVIIYCIVLSIMALDLLRVQ